MMAVQRWGVGSSSVFRVEELLGQLFDKSRFFAGYDPEIMESLKEWLGANHISPEGNIISSIHSWLIEIDGKRVLVDGCVGDAKDRMPFRDWHEMRTSWLDNLHAAGCTPDDVDFVMCTHLHVDHVGWNTRLENGRWVPTFSNARYLFSTTEYEFWKARRAEELTSGFEVVGNKVFDDSVLPVVEAGLVDLVDGDHDILDGLRIEPAPGHTPGSITLELHTAGERALFTGDIMHHPIQIRLPDWNSAFCELPDEARATRRRVLEHCADTGALLMPAHFGWPHAGTIRREGGTFAIDYVEPNALS